MYIHRQVNHSIYRLVSLGGFFMIEEFTDLLDLVKNQCLLTASNELSFNLNNNFRFSLAQSINFKPESFFPFYLWICQIFKE